MLMHSERGSPTCFSLPLLARLLCDRVREQEIKRGGLSGFVDLIIDPAAEKIINDARKRDSEIASRGTSSLRPLTR